MRALRKSKRFSDDGVKDLLDKGAELNIQKKVSAVIYLP